MHLHVRLSVLRFPSLSCILTCIHTYIFTYTSCICTYTYMRKEISLYMCIYIYIYIYTQTYVYVYTYIYMHICVYIYVYIYICICIYIYMDICMYIYIQHIQCIVLVSIWKVALGVTGKEAKSTPRWTSHRQRRRCRRFEAWGGGTSPNRAISDQGSLPKPLNSKASRLRGSGFGECQV